MGHEYLAQPLDGGHRILLDGCRRRGGGSFVGISSIAASNTHRWFGAYGPSKAGLDHLLQLAADELGASWVRVDGIRPGLTRTEMVAPVLDLAPLADD